MFPSTPRAGLFLTTYVEESAKKSTRIDPKHIGLQFEIALPKKTDDSKERKVVLAFLPAASSQKELFEISRYLGTQLYLLELDEVCVDRSFSKFRDHFGRVASFCALSRLTQDRYKERRRQNKPVLDEERTAQLVIEGAHTKQKIVAHITQDEELRDRFLELGAKIADRVRDRLKEYTLETFGGPLCLSFEQQNVQSLLQPLPATLHGQIHYYLDLTTFLKGALAYRSSMGSAWLNAKESFYKACAAMLGDEVNTREIFETQIEEARKEFDLLVQTTRARSTPAGIDQLIEEMKGLTTEAGESELTEELGRWKRAWREGDLKTLDGLAALSSLAPTLFNERPVPVEEVKRLAASILENIENNRSSLFLLPLRAAAGGKLLQRLADHEEIDLIQVVAKAARQEMECEGLLYSIGREGIEQKGHLLGTVHIASLEMLRLNRQIHEVIDRSSAFYFEIDLTDPNSVQNGALALNLAEISEEQTARLVSNLPLFFEVLRQELIKKGASLPLLQQQEKELTNRESIDQKLELIVSLISNLALHRAGVVHQQEMWLSPAKPVGIDHLVAEMAIWRHKPIHGLEKLTEARKAMRSKANSYGLVQRIYLALGEQESEESMRLGIANFISSMCEQTQKTLRLWSIGDEESLEKEASRQFASSPPLFKEVVTDRDQVMAEAIDAALLGSDGPSLFSIGALHIPGVRHHLKEKGWKITRLWSTKPPAAAAL